MNRGTAAFVRGSLLAVGIVLLRTMAAAGLQPVDHFTLRDLEQDSPMTPRRFGGLFRDFRFTYCPYVLPVEDFLRDRYGDCDDYALLADHILRRNGYRPRFVQVSLAGSDIAHAICYVTESKAYLDYNNRRYELNLERSGATLREIATKVADSFEKNWTSVTEYTFSYEDYRKQSRYTVVKTDSPSLDPDRQGKSAP